MAYSLAVAPTGGPRTWTVLGGGYSTVLPVEEWLETHRHLWSPNTVRAYATALAQWWTFLEQRGEADRWRDVGVPAVAGFLSWLRNGGTVEHAIGKAETAPSAQTLEARLAALISFYRWQEAVFDVPVAGPVRVEQPDQCPADPVIVEPGGFPDRQAQQSGCVRGGPLAQPVQGRPAD